MSEATYISWAFNRLNVPFPVVKKARSGDNSTVFDFVSGDARWFLKIGDRLVPECARSQWLQGRLPVPDVVALDPVGEQEALLMSAVPGTNLAVLAKRLSPDKIVEMLATALRSFHFRQRERLPLQDA